MSTQSETDAINAATKFNEAVESTEAVGTLRAEMKDVRADVSEIKTDVKHIRTTVDHWGGVAVVVSTLVSIATGVVVWIGGTFIVHMLGFK